MASAPTPLQIGGLVPNVWFDLFGRIIPAPYLLLGVLICEWNTSAVQCCYAFLEGHPVTGLPIAFLLFLGASYMVGWLLGTVSYWFPETLTVWYRLRRLCNRNAPVVADNINAILADHRGVNWSQGLEDDEQLRRARDHCLPNLAY
jgi:hypothetical protein